MTDAPPSTERLLTVEGITIPKPVEAALLDRMRAAPFRAMQLQFAAEAELGGVGLNPDAGMRLADRLIQRHRKTGDLNLTRAGRTTTFTWKS